METRSDLTLSSLRIDPSSDNASVAALDVEGPVTMTKTLSVTGAVSVTGRTTLSGGTLAPSPIIHTGDSVVLTASDSGKTVIFNVAGASTVTLPEPELGMKFSFLTTVTATNDHVIKTSTDNHGFVGGVNIHSSEAGNSDHFTADTDGSNDHITMNGSTTGGLAGSRVDVVAILGASAAKCWAVSGSIHGTGTLVTPFGDAQL